MKKLLTAQFKRKFSLSFYKNMKLKLGEMSFFKDFVNDTRGDLYPMLSKSGNADEYVESNRYGVRAGSVCRIIGQFFPYATYEMTAKINGEAGFKFILPVTEAEITRSADKFRYRCGEHTEEFDLPEASDTMELGRKLEAYYF